MQRLSIIIPVLNEANTLPDVLEHLMRLQSRDVEVIMVDGGSEDGSCALIGEAGLTLQTSARGRANQMNAGALHATGDVLLFLHADTHLPTQADSIILRQFDRGSPKVWGRFAVRISGSAWMLAVISCLMNLRSRLTGIATGDHGLFMTRTAFNAVGGFPEQPLMEDVALCLRLKQLSPPICLSEFVITSGRRWLQHGIWRTIFLMWRLRFRYWRGACPHQLAQEYQ